jgi:hypothetical protein
VKRTEKPQIAPSAPPKAPTTEAQRGTLHWPTCNVQREVSRRKWASEITEKTTAAKMMKLVLQLGIAVVMKLA